MANMKVGIFSPQESNPRLCILIVLNFDPVLFNFSLGYYSHGFGFKFNVSRASNKKDGFFTLKD